MKRLKNNPFTIYDAQIIIYYCFLFKEHRIIELTTKARRLTQFLINNQVKIVVPQPITNEIKNKGSAKIISEYLDSKCPTQIIGLTENPTDGFKYFLEKKLEKNFNRLINSDWFEVRPYMASENSINSIRDFFENIDDEEKLNEFLYKKDKNNPVPSTEDMQLISFSKHIHSPIISNDRDITFFAEELLKNGLSSEIYNFKELDFYNT